MQCTKQLSRQIWWHFGPRLGAPDYFGDRALLGSEIRSASIAALEEPRELKENPWWNRQMKKHDMKKSPLKTESCMFLEGVICLVWLVHLFVVKVWFCLINMFLCGELRSSSPYRGVMWDPFVTLQDLQDTELWKMGKETFQEMMLGFLELNWNKVYHHHWCRKRGGLMWRSDKGQCFHREDGKKDVGSEWCWIIGGRLFWRLWCRAKGV